MPFLNHLTYCHACGAMMPRRCLSTYTLFLILAAGTTPSRAQEASTIPWMTGERLVKLMGNVSPAELAWTPESPFSSRALAAEYRDMLNGEFVQGYLHALHDASEGKEWCWRLHKPKPDTLISTATDSLQRMSAHQLKRNAADLVIEVWRKTWPCPVNQRRKP